MKKIYILFTLLFALAFLTACTDENTDTKTCIQAENLPAVCQSYCTALAPPPEPELPPITVEPNVISDTTTFSNPIPNVGNAVVDRERNSITIKFLNNKGSTITLPLTGTVPKYSKSECENPQINAIYKGEYVKALVTEIENGEEFTVIWDCDNLQEIPASGTPFSADLTFEYKINTGMIHQEIGTVIGQY